MRVHGLLLLMAAGCSTAHMVVPGDIAAGSEVLEARDRSSFSGSLTDESFKLGPYAVSDVDRDWNSTRTADLFGISEQKTAGGYGFRFTRRDGQLAAGCVTESGDNSATLAFGMRVSSTFARLGCTCGTPESGVKLLISAQTDQKYAGELTTRKGSYRISALYEADGMLSNGEPTGYRVDGDAAVGAVEVLRPGRAFFRKGLDLEEHGDLACLYAGLMLYEPPKRDK